MHQNGTSNIDNLPANRYSIFEPDLSSQKKSTMKNESQVNNLNIFTNNSKEFKFELENKQNEYRNNFKESGNIHEWTSVRKQPESQNLNSFSTMLKNRDSTPIEADFSVSKMFLRKNINIDVQSTFDGTEQRNSQLNTKPVFQTPKRNSLNSGSGDEQAREKIDFTPNVFQKLKVLEDEVSMLRRLNDKKEQEIKDLMLKVEQSPNYVEEENEKMSAEIVLLRKENESLNKELQRVRKTKSNSTINSKLGLLQNEETENIKIKMLELENQKLVEKYENYKKIVNNSTFSDIEVLNDRIFGLEIKLKEMTRLNKRLLDQNE